MTLNGQTVMHHSRHRLITTVW